MAQKFFQETAKGILVGKRRKTLTLAAFSNVRCGRDLGSALITNIASFETCNMDVALTSSRFVEGWFRLYNHSVNSGATVWTLLSANQANSNFTVTWTDSSPTIKVFFTNAGASSVTFNTGVNITFGEWIHYGFGWKLTGGVLTFKFYANGVLQFTGTNTMAALPFIGFGISLGLIAAIPYVGNVGEFRFYDNVSLTDETIFQRYNKFLNPGVVSGLLTYYKFNKYDFPPMLFADTVFPDTTITAVANSFYLDTTLWPPLIFGSSFIALSYVVTLATDFSFKFPVVPTTGTNFMLCVSWTDRNNVFQRRKMWDMPGVDIAPIPAAYAGERINGQFKLECWNIDGTSSITLPSNLVLNTSHFTLPSNSRDVIQIAEQTSPVQDTTLSQNFPLTGFPLVFNTQQTFT